LSDLCKLNATIPTTGTELGVFTLILWDNYGLELDADNLEDIFILFEEFLILFVLKWKAVEFETESIILGIFEWGFVIFIFIVFI